MINRLDIADHVHFIGQVAKERRDQLLESCDIVAVPSLWEGFGMTALEGMAANKVILTSNLTGLKEVVKGYNKTVDLNDNDFIRQIFQKIKLKSNFDQEKWSWEKIGKQYLLIARCPFFAADTPLIGASRL